MLIRNISSRLDKAVQEKKQNELLRIQMANQANIAKARKESREGNLAPPPETLRSPNEVLQSDNEISQLAQNKLLELYPLSKTRSILTELSSEEKRFLSAFWSNFKKQFSGIDGSLVTPPMFLRLLRKYISDTISQKGLGAVAVNEPNEMRDVIPSREIVRRTLPDMAEFFPDEQVYDSLNRQPEASQERFVRELLKNYKNIAPLSEWLQNPTNPNLAPISQLQRRNIRAIFESLKDIDDDDFEDAEEETRRAEEPRPKKTPTKVDNDRKIDAFAQRMKEEGRFDEVFPPPLLSTIKTARVNDPERVAFMKKYEKELNVPFSTPKKGRGIQTTFITGWVDVGKVKFNSSTLNEKQTLCVRGRGGGPVAGFERVIPVSDCFVELLNVLSSTSKVDKRILKELDQEEQRMFERMIQKSGLARDLGVTITPTDEEKKLIERFNLVKGSYLAGNTGVKEELRSLILRFARDGKIDKRSAMATLQEIV